MRIVVDEDVAGARAAFGPFGDVVTVPGREIDTEDVSRADALVVRSVTRVDRTLVGGSRLRFVGTTTSGYDHVDVEALAARGIAFVNAPGCNATAVADWVVAVLAALHAAGRHGFGRGTAGIVGAGEVGARVARRLAALGYDVRICDPPRAEREGAAGFVDLATALACDVVSLHVPLTDAGAHATRGLLDAAALDALAPGAVLLNAARGGVVEEEALLRRLEGGADLAVALDTWAREPAIDTGLLARVDLGTPHIAGHTLEGRLRGTAIVARAAAEAFGVALDWDWRTALPPAPELEPRDGVVDTILAAYDPRAHDRQMRRLASLAPGARAGAFDAIRRACGRRREFGFHAVGADAPAAVTAAGLGVADPADEGI